MDNVVYVDAAAAKVGFLVIVHVTDVKRHHLVRLSSLIAQNAWITAIRVLRKGPSLVLEPIYWVDTICEMLSDHAPIFKIATAHIALEVSTSITRNSVDSEAERSQVTLVTVEDLPDSGLVLGLVPDPVGLALACLNLFGTMGDRRITVDIACFREIDRHHAVSVVIAELHPLDHHIPSVRPVQVDDWHPDQAKIGLTLLWYGIVFGIRVDSGIMSGRLRRRPIAILCRIVLS